MRASIATPEGGAPGTALIEVFDAPALQGEPNFTILSSNGYLSPDGWQESSTPLAPDAWDNDSGCLRLGVSAAIVDQLDPLETYRLGIGDQVCALQVGDLIFSHMGGGQGMGQQTAPEPEAPVQDSTPPATEEQPPVDAEPEKEPEPEAPAPETPAPAPAAETPQAPVDRLTMAPDTDAAPLAPASGKSRLPLILLLVLLLAGGGLAYHLASDKQPSAAEPLPALPKPDVPTPHAPESATPAAPEPEAPAKPASPAPEPTAPAAEETPATPPEAEAPAAPAPAPAAEPQTPAPQVTGVQALSEARELLRRNAAPEETLAAGKALRTPNADERQSDAAFLLLEDAAQKGNAEAMLLVGRFYDPASDLPRGSIPPDMSQARSWYEAARDKGNSEAAQALSALRDMVEKKARQGDDEARLLLQNWK